MSHELRTPMNAVLGMIGVVLPRAVDPVVRDCLQTAKESAELLLTILNDLLDSARIEAGKLALEAAPFSLRQMLRRTSRVFSMQAEEKGLRFDWRISGDAPDVVVGDRLRLQQVLLNLLGNAVKFTAQGEVTLSVRVAEPAGDVSPLPLGEGPGVRVRQKRADSKRTLPSNCPHPRPLTAGEGTESDPHLPSPAPSAPIVAVTFSVHDTGIGIPPDELKHIFEPFAQADPSMARRFGGTGLGLAISARLVALMGGRVAVESEPGQGSTFRFTVELPLSAEPLPESEAAHEIVGPAATALRILLVEDNAANQKLAAYILEGRGHTVEIAGDGRQALGMTNANCYDVILMDVQMPGMDGLEITAAIRAGKRRSPTHERRSSP